jgi:DNA-binding transcriptional ArsR family regulator
LLYILGMAGRKPKGNDLFNALGHPMRRRILREMLETGDELSPRELAGKLSEQLSALSYHVRVLAECKAVELVRTEQIRGSTQHFYRAKVKANWALSALEAGEEPPSEGHSLGEEKD